MKRTKKRLAIQPKLPLIDKATKKMVDSSKEAIKEETKKTIDTNLPKFFGLAGAILTAAILLEPERDAKAPSSVTIINNYYIEGRKQ